MKTIIGTVGRLSNLHRLTLCHMESRGLERRDLEPYIGTRARVSEILNRRRPLTLRMIQKLHDGLGIPAETLIQPYELVRAERVPESASTYETNRRQNLSAVAERPPTED